MRAVVVIEDEPTLCEVIMEALVSSDVSVCCARTGLLGVMMLQQEHFDLALIDVGLPDVSGIVIAEIAANANTPVLLMSGDLHAVDGLAGWGLPYLEKPFPLAELNTEAARIMSDSQNQIQGLRDTLSRLRDTINGLDDASGNTRRLIDLSWSVIDLAISSCPIDDEETAR